MVGVEMVNTNNTSMVKLGVSDNFPVGMRILAVDDDPVCLSVLTQMLRQCSYEVTFCTRAREALALLREKKDGFDLVISDVVMPDMDGFKLLELIGLEMDLPVIMTSSHGETSTVMKGVTHGACDYLLKPVRIEELRNIWQHVVRRRRHNETKDVEASYGSMDESERQHRRNRSDDGADYTSSANDGANDSTWKHQKRRKDEDDNEQEEDPSTLKKPRVVWSVELHQQFVNAVNTLGIDKAVPKKILEHMNVQGLTRENVASHLQKYRLYLRRLSGAQQSPGAAASFCSPSADPTFGFAPLSNTVHFPPVQAGIMRPHTNMDPSMLVQPQVGYLRPQAHLNMHNQVNINQMNLPHSRINLPNPSSLEVNRGGLAVSIPNRGGLEVNLPDQISPVENVYGQYRHNGYRPMGYPLHIPYSTQGVVSSNTPYTDDSGIIVTSPGIRTKMSNLTLQNNGNANGNHGEGIGVTVSHHPSIPARFAVDDNEQMGTSGELDTGNDIASIYFEERFMSNDYRL